MAKKEQDTPPARQRPYPKMLRLPSAAEYQKLVLALAKSAHRADMGADKLREAYFSLHQIFEFINNDPNAQAAIMPGPLNMLANALYDLGQGANPTLLAKAKKGPGKPTNLATRDLMHARIAAAMDFLVSDGESLPDAANWIAIGCNTYGIKVKGQSVTAKKVERWREDFSADEVRAVQARDLFNHVRARRLPGLSARACAQLQLEFVAKHSPG